MQKEDGGSLSTRLMNLIDGANDFQIKHQNRFHGISGGQ